MTPRAAVATLATCIALVAPAAANTLFSSPPWIVTFETSPRGEPTCAISLVSPEGYGVSVERRPEDVSVNILDLGKDYQTDQKEMWVTIGEQVFMWDGTRAGPIAVTVQAADDGSVTGLIDALGSTETVEIGTFEEPSATFSSPPSDKAKAVFAMCTDLL